MRYHYVILLLGALLLTSGCRTIQLRDLDTSLTNTKRLPALEPLWKPASLESLHFSERYDTLASGNTYPYATVAYPPAYYPLVPSIEAQDAKVLFEREVTKNLTETFGPKAGYITCQVASAIARPRQAGLLYVSTLLLGLPSLLGLPQAYYQTELLLEVQVLDAQRNRVGLYSAIGRESVPVALYWGYRPDDARRLSSINAFKRAFASINQQIQADYDRLATRLQP